MCNLLLVYYKIFSFFSNSKQFVFSKNVKDNLSDILKIHIRYHGINRKKNARKEFLKRLKDEVLMKYFGNTVSIHEKSNFNIHDFLHFMNKKHDLIIKRF